MVEEGVHFQPSTGGQFSGVVDTCPRCCSLVLGFRRAM
jgi:hypothetical protein